MVGIVGNFGCAMVRRDSSAHSGLSAHRYDFRNRTWFWAVDELPQRLCEHLWIVDPAAECIEACRGRFAARPRMRCYANDGRSLSMFPDESIDFACSFDSLVHLKREIIEAYLSELGAKLRIGGRGFIHHSNLGEYAHSLRERLPPRVRKLLIKAKILDWEHLRDPRMNADSFRALCARPAVDRLFFFVRAKRFGRPIVHANNSKPEFHARSRADPPTVTIWA